MKVYSIKAVIIAIFYMLTSIRAGEKKETITQKSNFYKLYWVQGANPYYNSKNPIIVHENCTPNDILDTLIKSKLYNTWNENKFHFLNGKDYVPTGVYITLFSENEKRINSNYNLIQNGKSNWVYGNDYDDNNNDIPIKILLQKADNKQEPITDNDKKNLVNSNENVIIGKGEEGTVLFSGLKKGTSINTKNNKQNNINSNKVNQGFPSMIAAVMAISSQPTGNNNTQDQSPQKKNDISETEESDTQKDNNDKVTNDIELGNDNPDVDSNNKPNNNNDDITKINSNDDTSDNNNKDNEQPKTEKGNTNEELIHPKYKEILSDIEEEDDEGKNKKLTVGKVIAFLTVISLFGIGGFYIYKNGHKLTKSDVKKKKKKQQ